MRTNNSNPQATGSNSIADSQIEDELIRLIEVGQSLQAVKLAKQHYDLSLPDAKQFVEELQGGRSSSSRPPPVPRQPERQTAAKAGQPGRNAADRKGGHGIDWRGGLVGVALLFGLPLVFACIFGSPHSTDPTPEQQIEQDQKYWQQQREKHDRDTGIEALKHLPPGS
jgi:hypothetical protein